MGTNPVQGVLDRQPPLPPGFQPISSRRRVGSPRRPVQGRIRQTQTFRNDCFFGLRSGQLRNRIHLIQRKRPFGESGPKHRQVLESPRHPDQLAGRGMTKTEPGRNPLRKIACPIRQEPLAHIRIDQPVADLRVENGQTREQMRQHPISLIVRKALPLHAPNVRNRCDKTRQKPAIHKRNLRNSWRWDDPPSAPPEAPDPSRYRSNRPGCPWRLGPWRRSSGQRQPARHPRCPDR